MLRWSMSPVAAVGFAAGALTTLAYLPQALHSFRTRSVRDLSMTMLVSLNVGLALWVVYGVLDPLLAAYFDQRAYVAAGTSPVSDEGSLPRAQRGRNQGWPEPCSSGVRPSPGRAVIRAAVSRRSTPSARIQLRSRFAARFPAWSSAQSARRSILPGWSR